MRVSRFKSLCTIALVLSLVVLPSASQAWWFTYGAIIDGATYISNTLMQYAIGEGINILRGRNIERQLNDLRNELQEEIRNAEPGAVEELQEQLDVAETQLETVKELLKGKPSRKEMERFRNQVRADFALVSTRLEEHDVRLGGHDTKIQDLETELQDLRQRLVTLEEFLPTQFPEIPDHLPTNPKIAILSLGEPGFAQALEIVLEDRLSAMELEASRGNASLQVSDLLQQYGEDIPVSKLVPLLTAEGFHALILARVKVVGYREHSYLGRYSEATDARLRLSAYLLHGGRSLGRGWDTSVVYTAINADRKAEEALGDSTWEIAQEIRKGWQNLRVSSGG